MSVSLLVPIAVALVTGGGFVVNEWSHGGVSESMGLGHHHMLDHPDHACHPSGAIQGAPVMANTTNVCPASHGGA